MLIHELQRKLSVVNTVPGAVLPVIFSQLINGPNKLVLHYTRAEMLEKDKHSNLFSHL